MTTTIDTVVVGAGHAGLATSRLLTAAGRDHVVLDRGRVGERWRSERWDSLRLLTPNWMTRLPGWTYAGAAPEGYMPAVAFVRHLERYATSFEAPVLERVRVERLAGSRDGFLLDTDRDTWRARNVVVATGPWGRPHVPAEVRPAGDVLLTHASAYRSPGLLPPGGVLVVGASASGVQIADELARSGRDVVLAVGRHARLPRRYRGMDIFWWLERTGRLARTVDELPDPAARREPSLQLVGRAGEERGGFAGAPVGGSHAPDDVEVDLGALQRRGVRLVGRLEGLAGHRAGFRDDLARTVGQAERRLRRFLDAVDDNVAGTGLSAEVWPAARPAPVVVPDAPGALDLRAEGIATVLLATGYRPDLGWLDLPVLDDGGAVVQYRGVTRVPGLYVVGQRFQHRRDSGFIDGARHDARSVVEHLTGGDRRHAGSPVDAGSDR